MPAAEPLAEPELKRSLSLPLLTLYGLGTIIGAGIYVLIGAVAAFAGPYTPLAFLIAASVAGFTALTYAELATRYPRSGAEAVYIGAAFPQRWLAAAVGWLVVGISVTTAATLANGFVGYLALFSAAPKGVVVSVLLLALGALAAWGISESAWVAAVCTVAEIGGLALVVGVAGDHLAELPLRAPELLPPLTASVWWGIVLGAGLAFYAFIGFEDMANVAEEVHDPQRTLPRAMLLALLVAALFYLVIALIAVLAIPVSDLARSSAPLAALVEHQYAMTSVGALALVAVLNGALIQLIKAARMVYGLSRQTLAHPRLGEVHARTRTPLYATALVTLLALGLALWLPLLTLAELTSSLTLLIFTAMHLTLWRIKRQANAPAGAVSYPAWVPPVGAALCIGLLLVQAVAGITG